MNLSLPLLAAALAISLFSSSCLATASDISDIKETINLRDEEYDQNLASLRSGAISEDEYLAREALSRKQLNDEFDAKFDEVQDRGRAWLEGMPSTGNTLVDLILGGVLTSATGVPVTNFVRDRKRRVRGEPVGKMATPAPATPPLAKATPPILSAPSIIVAAPSGP